MDINEQIIMNFDPWEFDHQDEDDNYEDEY